MRWALLFVVMAACTDDVTFGQVQAIDDGSGRLKLTACLDAKLLSCGGGEVELTGTNGSSSATLKYSGLFFPEHIGAVDLADRDMPVVVADGDARVVMTLPTAFELTSEVTPDAVAMRWIGADEPMIWTAGATCETRPTYPHALGDVIEDDGELTITFAHLEALLERPLAGCTVDIELSRVFQGSLDDSFRAENATGIVRRTVSMMID
jgi:hypothetical protein